MNDQYNLNQVAIQPIAGNNRTYDNELLFYHGMIDKDTLEEASKLFAQYVKAVIDRPYRPLFRDLPTSRYPTNRR